MTFKVTSTLMVTGEDKDMIAADPTDYMSFEVGTDFGDKAVSLKIKQNIHERMPQFEEEIQLFLRPAQAKKLIEMLTLYTAIATLVVGE